MKYFFSLALIVISIFIHAQEFKKFRVGIGGGSSFLTNFHYGNGQGFILFVEPSYRLKKDISMGFRCEVSGNVILSSVSYSLNGQYYFLNRRIRAFTGLGVGVYVFDYSYELNHGGAKTMGFYPRIGFDHGHFSLLIDYNIAMPVKETLTEFVSPGVVRIYSGNVDCSYLAVRASVVFGGGVKK